MNAPVVSIIGWSGSGKTTFIEKLLPVLKKRGIRVAVIKHDGHEFEMDYEGKDTWRFTKAGACAVAITSASHAALLYNRPVELEDLIKAAGAGADIILLEGFKSLGYPRIEVHRLANGKPMYEKPENLIAVVTDDDGISGAPVFSLDDASGVADLLCSLL
ncbi:MAG: molybdopterin-guanine dinucleotide biosynthesis protein B [Oscillospiraceae bacterium]|jgi:molybdopterin-guanine dinucleotide biosynthesis protein MobB